ncbi:cobalamin biosynthesis protein CobD [Rossellomorea aquimaris]|uniref:Cobalamin biosynthesis protein CobD n=2 Tax=Rossellomorea aquimaris TaxID=189382 RepID=A0A5D4TQX1_9BACI|nr:cobalamin biosynthesis protein CobD [Rossellomorea aquimaris]TYS83717.1 cobalamin biosynthesis protein CobD [Rossellomorea aquimaris]
MMIHHLFAITIAYLLDLWIGDPPHWPHPVKWMGKAISRLDRRLNKGGFLKRKGIVMVSILVVAAFILTSCLIWASYSMHTILGILVEAIVITTTISQKSLRLAALEVLQPLEENNLKTAREKLSYIVGRDTENLNESEIVRGTVETVAENTSDGITAPLFWALIGGAPLAIVYRCVNTCDSMVGYKNKRYIDFGWASAKLDDVLNWIPSRITGFILFFCIRPVYFTYKEGFRILLNDAKKHPSPNSGWGEAAVAVSLGVQLGGLNTYKGMVSQREKMGRKVFELERNHIPATISRMQKACFIFIMILWIGGVFVEITRTWIESAIYI